MRKLSNSTRLMNVFIGLSLPNPHYEPVLYNQGYQLESIEPHFVNTNGDLINPDLQYKSHEDKNLVFIECKLGAIEHEQALKYKNLTKTDIIQSNISSLDMSNSQFEIIYCCDETSKDKLTKGDDLHSYGFSILCCNDNNISIERNRIKGNKLKTILSNQINIPDKIPTSFYPFGPDDKKSHIAMSIFQSLLRLSGEGKEEIGVDDILRDSHPLYDTIHTTGKNKLKEIVGKILDDLDQNDFKDVIKRMRTTKRFRINPRSYKKFRDLCLNKIEQYKMEAPQKSIFEY